MRLLKIVFFLFLFHSNMLLWATTIEVGPNRQLTSIKKAIAIAKPGDTIKVFSGLYKEKNIVIDKRIVFIGVDFPILDGEKKYEVVSIKADSVVIKGFKVVNSGHAALDDPCGIKVYNQSFVHIENNILDDVE